VTFDFTDVQRAWQSKGEALGLDVARDAAAATVIMAAARAGLLDPQADLLAVAVAVEATAHQSSPAAVIVALHAGTARALAGDDRFSPVFRGEAVAAVGLSSDEVPDERDGKLFGRAPWVAPITDRGVAVVGPRREREERMAYAVALDAPGVTVETVRTAALTGLVCGHVTFTGAACVPIGPTQPIMATLRVLMAAAGLGMGRRALREALATARAAHTAAAGEQTVQGLLADAATELDAAMLMTWKAALAAGATSPLLADASLAKLMTTNAAQRAVERATQVVGADSFREGHLVERLAQDVRALELFAGRTEALRAAVAEEILPASQEP
jgi:acyl-CoA dehydrogenase